jgi:hypothetical protein
LEEEDPIMRNTGARTMTSALVVALALFAPSAPSLAGGDATGLEKLKALVGEWEGKTHDGETARVSYEVVSDGTAVVETLSEGELSMVTVYHTDGDHLALTHYCGAGNQPRMRSEKPAAGEVLHFSFVDATNLPSPESGHMHSLAIRFEGPDHVKQIWTWRQEGKEQHKEFEWVRKN